MIESILNKLVRNEKVVAAIVMFILGAISAGLGLNSDAVKRELCSQPVLTK